MGCKRWKTSRWRYKGDNGNFDSEIEAIQAYVTDTGLSEFDYEA